MAKQTRARKPTAITMAEMRTLLNAMVGKTVRQRTIRNVVVEVASDGWTHGIDVNAYLLSRAECPLLLTMDWDEIHCVCKNEAELLEVLHYPANGEWRFIDEGGMVTRRLA